jgi:hypothetical protein
MFSQEQLGLLANIVQIFNYMENTQQTSNDKIMLELQKQDEIFLNEIIARLERIEKSL